MQELIPPIRKETLSGIEKRFMDHLLTGQRHGFFPVADSGFWHGGIHLDGDSKTPVVAIADGELVAYRLNKTVQEGKLDGEKQLFSTSFVLLRHQFITPNKATIKFYSLYMHLLPMGGYSEEQLKDGPPIFLQKRYSVSTNTDGRGLAIYDEEEETIGLIPKDAYFEVEKDAPGKEHWAGRKGYKEVRYGEIEGYAEVRNNAVAVSGAQWKVTTIKHSPLDPADMGLNVRDKSNSKARVLRVAPRGSIIRFKEPKTLTDSKVLRDNAYHELKDGGFVSYSMINIEAKPVVREDLAYDSVERPAKKIMISQGDILGYAGPYCEHAKILHFEIFTDDVGFLQNPGKDLWGRRILKLKQGAKLKIQETKTVKTKEGSKTQTAFEKDAGMCTIAMSAPEQGVPYKDEAGAVWHEVLFDFEKKKTGWIAANDPDVEGVFSPYEWLKLWEEPLEDKEFADDGFVDTPRLFERLDTNKDKKIDHEELKHAYGDANDRQWLKHLICKHPSEWDAGLNGIKWNRLKKEPWNYTGSKAEFFDQALTHIKALQWWNQASGAAPESPNVYHFHPIGFIEHMNMMASPLTEEERFKIMMVVSKHEGEFYECNKDTEFSIEGLVSYTGKAHIGLSWGFIQFTQDSGSLGKVLERMDEKHHDLFVSTFGSNWKELIDLTNKPGISAKDSWLVKGIELEDGRSARVQPIALEKTGPLASTKKDLWSKEWVSRFQAAGNEQKFKEVQIEMAIKDYLIPALATCKKMNIRTAKGIAIAFDRQVNRGSADKVFRKKTDGSDSFSPMTERQFLERVRDVYPKTNSKGKPHHEYKRLNEILSETELKEINYDPETY